MTDIRMTRPTLSHAACDIVIRQRTRLVRILSDEYHRLMEHEFSTMKNALPTPLKRLLDIGGGLGGVHLFTYAHAGGDVDIHFLDHDRVDPVMRYGYRESTEAYNSIAESRNYLTEGGIAAEKLFYWNAGDNGKIEELRNMSCSFDVVISLKSWCFHYPAGVYANLASTLLAPGGVLIVDIRHSCAGEDQLERHFSMCGVLWQDSRSRRVKFTRR